MDFPMGSQQRITHQLKKPFNLGVIQVRELTLNTMGYRLFLIFTKIASKLFSKKLVK